MGLTKTGSLSVVNRLVGKLPLVITGRGRQRGHDHVNVFGIAVNNGPCDQVSLYANGCTLVVNDCDPRLESAWKDFDSGFHTVEDAWRSETALRVLFAVIVAARGSGAAKWFDS